MHCNASGAIWLFPPNAKQSFEEVHRTHVFARVDDEQDSSVAKMSQKKKQHVFRRTIDHCKITTVDVRQFG